MMCSTLNTRLINYDWRSLRTKCMLTMMYFSWGFLKEVVPWRTRVTQWKSLLGTAVRQDAGEPESPVAARANGAAVGWTVAAAQVLIFYRHCRLSGSWCSANFLLNAADYRVSQKQDSRRLGGCLSCMKQRETSSGVKKTKYIYSNTEVQFSGTWGVSLYIPLYQWYKYSDHSLKFTVKHSSKSPALKMLM